MSQKITKIDVFLYFANELDRGRRREVEAACRIDPRVQGWFADLMPRAEELSAPLPQLDLDAPETRRLFALAYQSVAAEEEGVAAADEHDGAAGITPLDMNADELWTGPQGQMAFRTSAPRRIAAGNGEPAIVAYKPPMIHADFASGRLTIAQWASAVPTGVVNVVAAKVVAPGKVEKYAPVRVPLTKGGARDAAGEKQECWYKELAIAKLVPNLQPGDDLVFFVEPAPAGPAQP